MLVASIHHTNLDRPRVRSVMVTQDGNITVARRASRFTRVLATLPFHLFTHFAHQSAEKRLLFCRGKWNPKDHRSLHRRRSLAVHHRARGVGEWRLAKL